MGWRKEYERLDLVFYTAFMAHSVEKGMCYLCCMPGRVIVDHHCTFLYQNEIQLGNWCFPIHAWPFIDLAACYGLTSILLAENMIGKG
jgi:hypothetical protein